MDQRQRVEARPDLTGRTLLDRYEVEQRLGVGGMAEVYRAFDRQLRRPVALKMLHPGASADPAFVSRLWREATATAALAHPNIVAIYDCCGSADEPFLVMELVEGESLRQVLRRVGLVPIEYALAVVDDLLGALDHAHARGVIHRDVKPDNVLITTDCRAKLADFGIAEAMRAGPRSDELYGSLGYIAPECWRAEAASPAADLYAVGAILYEMLTGRLPHGSDDAAAITARIHRGSPPPPSQLRPDLPRVLDRIILRALAPNPANRFPHAEAMRAVLRAMPTIPLTAVGRQPTAVVPEPTRRAGRAGSSRYAGLAPSLPWLGRPLPRSLASALTMALPLALFFLVLAAMMTGGRPWDLIGVGLAADAPGFRIATIWPHDGKGNAVSPSQARAVNVSLWPADAVRCVDTPPSLRLWRTRGNEPAEPVETGGRVERRTVDGRTFLARDFDNVAVEPGVTYRFFTWPVGSNVWVYGGGTGGAGGAEVAPTDIGEANPRAVDARIQVVWPHDASGQAIPSERAPLVNVAVDLFVHGTTRSVPRSFAARPILYVAEGSGPIEPTGGGRGITAEKITRRVGGQEYPRWVFNDVPVTPGRAYHFLVDAGDAVAVTHPTVWTHGPAVAPTSAAPSPPPPCH